MWRAAFLQGLRAEKNFARSPCKKLRLVLYYKSCLSLLSSVG